jgi:hypothetical protein
LRTTSRDGLLTPYSEDRETEIEKGLIAAIDDKHVQWFRCLKCARRCRKIYGGRYFRCRLCHRLRYASQRVRADQYASDRARKLAKRLHDKWGGATEEEYDFPPKPPRMRWATYNRLEAQYDDLENRWAVGIMARLGIVRL